MLVAEDLRGRVDGRGEEVVRNQHTRRHDARVCILAKFLLLFHTLDGLRGVVLPTTQQKKIRQERRLGLDRLTPCTRMSPFVLNPHVMYPSKRQTRQRKAREACEA